MNQNSDNMNESSTKKNNTQKNSLDNDYKTNLVTNSTKQNKLVPLLLGDELSSKEIDTILRRSPTKVLAIAGAPESGKTTLISAIYSQFHFGPFANYLFAGSETLLGFERRCHLSMISSGLEQPRTERTLDMEIKMLHLRLCRIGMEKQTSEILLSDVSGELFRDFSSSNKVAESLEWIRRANRFILLVDGEKLLSNEKRQDARSSATLILRTCFDNNLLGEGVDIDILLSKYDLIKESQKRKKALEFWKIIKDEFEQRLSSYKNNYRFMEIGSRCLGEYPELKSNLSELFSLWVKEPDSEEENFSELFKDINSEIFIEPKSNKNN